MFHGTMSSGQAPNLAPSASLTGHAADTTHPPSSTTNRDHLDPSPRTRCASQPLSSHHGDSATNRGRRSNSCPGSRDNAVAEQGGLESPDKKITANPGEAEPAQQVGQIQHAAAAQSYYSRSALQVVSTLYSAIIGLVGQALGHLTICLIWAYTELVARPRTRSHSPKARSTQPIHERPAVRTRGRPNDQQLPPNDSFSNSVPSDYQNQGARAVYLHPGEGGYGYSASSSDCPEETWGQTSNSHATQYGQGEGGPMRSLYGPSQHHDQRQEHLRQAQLTHGLHSGNVPQFVPSQSAFSVQSTNHSNPQEPVPTIFEGEDTSPVRGRQCDICGLVLRRPGLLDDHLNTHVGLRPHQCSICGQGFAQRGNVDRHMRTVHGVEATAGRQ
ncbi:hypothetical protein FRC08_000201 [Ceratobasidium sp. 394]|nr:hypothetical protein FRC08_000201 [Ceratobasidium sp. 394]